MGKEKICIALCNLDYSLSLQLIIEIYLSVMVYLLRSKTVLKRISLHFGVSETNLEEISLVKKKFKSFTPQVAVKPQ